MTDIIIHDEKRVVALIREAREFVSLTLRAAETVEAEVRAFAADRARQSRPYGGNVIPFPSHRMRSRYAFPRTRR